VAASSRAVGGPAKDNRTKRTAYELAQHGELDFFVRLRESLWKISSDPVVLRAEPCFLRC
jgi:hypothetical protein